MNNKLNGVSNKIKGICHKLDEKRQEYVRDKYENLRYIFKGFTLAIFILIAAFPRPANIGGKDMLIRLARGFEWAFATVLMTAIGVVLSLKYLKGCTQVLLLVLLFIFFIATLVSQIHQAGWFGRRGGE